MPLVTRDAINPVEMAPGVIRRTLTCGDRLMLIEVALEGDLAFPEHTHPQDKTGYLVSGRLRLDVGEESRDLSPGDAWLVPAGVPHKALTLAPTVVIEVFSPPNDDYR